MKSYDPKHITGRQLQAARVLAGLRAEDLAKAAGIGLATVRRAESRGGETVVMTANNLAALIRALDEAGVLLLERNGEGPGVRLK
jgi:transcriptional regulator with XRE-family HTH domain